MAKQTYTTGQVLTAAQMTALQANDYNWTVSAKTASYVLVAADAGTRITMSNAGATTITVNTALFTAGDTLTITNIGAGTCTITAGTATVSTGGSLVLNQYDSGTLYFSSTSAAIWNGANPGDITGVTAGTGISGGGTSGTVTITNSMATEITAAGDIIVGTGSGTFDNLPIGTTAQVLTADTTVSPYKVKWATPAAAASAMTFIKRGTMTAAANSGTTFDNVFSSTYTDYVVILEGFKSDTSTPNIQFQWRTSGPTTVANAYYGSNGLSSTTSGFSYFTSNASAQYTLCNTNNGSAESIVLNLTNVGTSLEPTITTLICNPAGDRFGSGGCLRGGAITPIGFIISGSANNLTGTITLYGLAKA
jgi:hypothetical protein